MKVVTITDQFVDFENIIHKFVIAAVSEPIDAAIDIYDSEGEVVDYTDAAKVVKLGVAICNPHDEYNEEKGKLIATNKAIKNKEYALYATQPGMINTPVVLALVRQEAEFIKSNPGRIISGYNEKKIKFDRNQEIRRQHLKEISELTPEEKEAYEASRKYPRVVALLSK